MHLNQEILDTLRNALEQNVRAFRRRSDGRIQYTINEADADDWEFVSIIPDLPSHVIDAILGTKGDSVVKESLTTGPLMRLTQSEVLEIFLGLSGEAELLANEALEHPDTFLLPVARLIQDAFIKKNGGLT